MYVTVLLCPQLAVVNLHPRWMACAVAFFQTSLTNPCHSGSDISLHRSGSDPGWYTDRVSAGSKWSCLPISDPLAKCVGLVSSKTVQEGRVIQRRPQPLPLPLDFCSDFLSILQMKTKLTVYQSLASCAAFTGSVWVEYVWWWVHGGSSLVFWRRTQQQMQTTQLRDTLSPGCLSLALSHPRHPHPTLFQPLHPFLEALPHSEVSPGECVCVCVCVCVRVWALEPCVYMWARRKVREKETFLVKCAIWAALGGAQWSKSFFPFLPLNWAHLQSPKNCGGTNHLPDKISLSFFYFKYLLRNTLQRGFLSFWYQTAMVWEICLKALPRHSSTRHRTEKL